jgi:phosphate transport system substrate-binding protein
VANRLLSCLVFVLLVSCGRTQDTSPTPELLPRLAVTPSLEAWVSSNLTAYQEDHGPPDFTVEVLSPDGGLAAVENGDVNLLIAGLEPPSDAFATLLGIEGIVVIVHPENLVRNYTLVDLAAIFSGRLRSWDALGGSEGDIQPVVPLGSDELRQRFEALVMSGESPTGNALLAPTPEAMLDAVVADPNAIGYLPMSQSSEDVRSVRVDGVLLGEASLADGRYPLWMEVIAIASAEPTGALRDWLAWVQTPYEVRGE